MRPKDYRACPAASRDYFVPYRGAATVCPGCSRSHWHVGRLSAECAFCATALPLEESVTGAGVFRVNWRAAA